MLRRVELYIAGQSLLTKGCDVLVALSGGADSVALLLVLLRLGYRVQAAHCNFHLRGDESDRDQRFVEQLCLRLDVPLSVRHFDTRAEAEATGESIEMAARRLRYEWFATFALPTAIAHHRDDNNETLLLNLVRGTGLHGLTGIQPRAEVMGTRVVRPLLCVGRDDILCYLERVGQDYVTDSTNLECDARRNIVRNRVMPLLAELNPSIGDTLQADMARFAEAERLYNAALEHSAAQVLTEDGSISIPTLDAQPAPLTVLHHLLAPKGFNVSTIESVYAERHGQSGALYASKEWRLLRHGSLFLLKPTETPAEMACNTLPVSGSFRLSPTRELRISMAPAPQPILREPEAAMFDAEKLTLPLTVRRVERGDRFRPFGMKGSVLVSDYMTNRHMSLFDREEQLVVLSGDEIVWLVGLRPSRTAPVTPSTRQVLTLRYSQSSPS